MTRLQAGRELDALIAEKVFGWTKMHYDDRLGRVGAVSYGKPPKDTPYEELVKLQGTGEGRHHVPHYSTDIAAAFEMEEAISKNHDGEAYAYHLQKIVKQDLEDDIGDHYTDEVLTYRIAHATPEQRCLAALKAVGVEI